VIFFYFSVLSFSFTKQVLIILSIPSFLLWIVWELILDMCSVRVAWYVLVCWYSPLELSVEAGLLFALLQSMPAVLNVRIWCNGCCRNSLPEHCLMLWFSE
jgi:hypothetical protein